MKIDWAALGIVAVVAIAATLVFTVLLSAGIRLVSQATVETNRAQRSGGVRGAGGGRTAVAARSTNGLRAAGYGLLGLAGLVVLFGLYLIVPAFH